MQVSRPSLYYPYSSEPIKSLALALYNAGSPPASVPTQAPEYRASQ